MCGICGKISWNNQDPIDDKLIYGMADVLHHRGPDDAGVYIYRRQNIHNNKSDVRVGLGHRRLSIIDLSKAAGQPMSNEDKTIWIVCNGEIYNFQDLRKELEAKGHIFSSKSDSEVIIHLYEDRGLDCVKEMRGMFAFALWDEKKQRLFLARDRVGKKPLNYAVKNGSLIFASEIKSILQDPNINRAVNIEAMDLYLTYGYVPDPQTIFLGIKKLPPAHMLILEKGNIKIERYWNLPYQNKLQISKEEYCQRILELLDEATRIRMISDVPLGVFLSGGIDSSAIVAIMSRFSSQRVKTFSIGFKEASFNELEYARKIARIFNTDHHEYIVETDALGILPKLIWHFNEPFADSSAIPTYYLSKMARQEVTVALNGDGGDESFAGYDRYIANRIAKFYSFIPRYIRKNIISSFIEKFPESTAKKDFIRNLKRFTRGVDFSKEKRYAYWMSIFDNELKNNLYSEDLKNRLRDIDPWDYIIKTYNKAGIKDFVDATLFIDTTTYLPNDLLVKVDIASMANSLEARSPFLDHKLMEFSASIPSALKLKGITTKYILKKALSKILPPEILHRKKAGFGIPVGTWLRARLKNYAYEVLLDGKSIKRNYFNREAIKKLLDEHASGKVDNGQRIWSLLNLELWHQMFIDNKIINFNG